MKKNILQTLGLKKLLCLALLPAILVGCGTEKKKEVVFERGWMGGQLEVVQTFPKQLTPRPKAGILVTALATNTPASLGGLREGDVILSLDHVPVANLKEFRKKIDSLNPGTILPLTVYRGSNSVDCNVTIGSEKYKKGGNFTIYLPIYYYGGWNLWPTKNDPGISLIALGYDLGKSHRNELHSVKNEYLLKCGSKNEPFEEDFKIWLAFMQLSKGKTILSQQTATP